MSDLPNVPPRQGRKCTICSHEALDVINHELVAGASLRNVAEQFRGLAVTSLHRHRHTHLPAALAQARSEELITQAKSLVESLQELESDAHRLMKKAELEGDFRTGLVAVRERKRIAELKAKVDGELAPVVPQVNIAMVREWWVVQGVLQGFPTARTAVAEALEEGS